MAAMFTKNIIDRINQQGTNDMKIVLATANKNKLIEIRNKLKGIQGIELASLDEFAGSPEVVEDGATFLDNALKKAYEISRFTGLAAMADDSGLVVDALDGRPGVYSARYGGDGFTDEDRNRLLLEEMRTVPPEKRSARFVCVIAVVMPDGRSFSAEGRCEGVIAEKPSGSKGFGYDPVFYLPESGQTMAELTLDEKNRISHRARALDSAREILLKLNK
jgi:XTP/dITP diphosphohydrolase